MGFMVKAPVLAKDPTKKYPIIAVSAGLRWLTEVLAWKSRLGFCLLSSVVIAVTVFYKRA